MRILQVIASVDPRGGGPVEVMKQLSEVLGAQGHHCEAASLDDPAAPWCGEFPHLLHAHGPGLGRFRYAPRLAPWLRSRASDFDCVVVRGLWRYTGIAVRRGLHGTGTPYVVFPHGMLDPWFRRRYPLKHLAKTLYWRWGEYPVLRDAAAVYFTSEQEMERARESFRPYRCKASVVKYGTASPPADRAEHRGELLRQRPELNGRRVLLFLGRLHEKKGCDLLIEAFAEVFGPQSEHHLLIAGPDSGGRLERLREQAEKLGVAASVTFTGMLQGRLKWAAFALAEAFVLPSHQENFGIAAAEALGCGIPVLLSEKVNIWREVIAAGAGFAAPDTKAGVSDLLRRWQGLSLDERELMSSRASACFEQRFEIHAAARDLLESLRRIQ